MHHSLCITIFIGYIHKFLNYNNKTELRKALCKLLTIYDVIFRFAQGANISAKLTTYGPLFLC